MAVQIHPPGRYGIENLAAVLSLKKHAFARRIRSGAGSAPSCVNGCHRCRSGAAHDYGNAFRSKIIANTSNSAARWIFFEHGDVSDYAHFAEVFNGAPIFNVFRADQNDTVDASIAAPRSAASVSRSVIDRAQRRARRDDYRKSETAHSNPASNPARERHHRPACAFHDIG